MIVLLFFTVRFVVIHIAQMVVRGFVGLKLPYICLTSEEKPRKILTQETCPDQGSIPGPLRDRRACCRLAHSGGLGSWGRPGTLMGCCANDDENDEDDNVQPENCELCLFNFNLLPKYVMLF